MTVQEAIKAIKEVTQLLDGLGESGIAKKINDAVETLVASHVPVTELNL